MSKKYFVTGTRKYGPAKPDSDLDIVMLQSDTKKLMDLLDFLGIPIKQTDSNPAYHSFYFKIDDFPEINIIVVEDESEFNAWKYATDIMSNIDPIERRQRRIKKMTELREEYIYKL